MRSDASSSAKIRDDRLDGRSRLADRGLSLRDHLLDRVDHLLRIMPNSTTPASQMPDLRTLGGRPRFNAERRLFAL